MHKALFINTYILTFLSPMKRKGTTSEHIPDRDRDFLRTFRDLILECRVIRIDDICQKLTQMPAPRFWVSEERAQAVIRSIRAGRSTERMTPTRREMYAEILRRVTELQRQDPQLSLAQAVARVVRNAAPKWYITPLSARRLLFRLRAKYKDSRIVPAFIPIPD